MRVCGRLASQLPNVHILAVQEGQQPVDIADTHLERVHREVWNSTTLALCFTCLDPRTLPLKDGRARLLSLMFDLNNEKRCIRQFASGEIPTISNLCAEKREKRFASVTSFRHRAWKRSIPQLVAYPCLLRLITGRPRRKRLWTNV
jgi:hypothetical protein